LTLADFIVREGLELGSETEPGHDGDEPLGRVVLIPLDGITIVHRELVVEVVVTFTNGDKGGDHVVARGMLVIKGRLTKPVGERVDAKGGMVDKDETGHGSVKVATFPVTPAKTRDDGGSYDGDDEENPDVVLVLPLDERVVEQIGDVGDTWLSARLENHPANV
jgi:hypothetical protein